MASADREPPGTIVEGDHALDEVLAAAALATRSDGAAAADPAEAATSTAPVARLVSELFVRALTARASDIHIEPKEHGVRVRFRIDGALCDVLELPVAVGPAVLSRIKILAGMNIVERRRPQDGHLATTVGGRPFNARVATVATVTGEMCVLRLVDEGRSLLGLQQLGMSEETAAAFATVVRAPFGMVLCAGPTGSGKTTTLYAALAEVADSAHKAMSIEDPVEYRFETVSQIQVNEVGGLDFATGLRSILRHDPDIILVGEIRDVETARIAIQSALTGHFVLSSVHATNATAAVHRFLDMGIESFLVASSVIAVVGQRLVRRICEHCRVEYVPSDQELRFYALAGGSPKATFIRGEGCDRCSGTGYRDRVGVFELLRVTPELKQLVLRWAGQDELASLASSQGMRSMEQEAVDLIERDVTTISEVVRTIFAG